MFKVGDKVVYPHHGAAVVERRETKVAFGEKREYLVLRLAYGDLTLMVPADNTEGVGLREVINDEEVEEVFAVLRKKEARMPTNWSRRYKNHSEKLRSGDIYQVAEVVRNLSIRDKDKGLSAGEKRMLSAGPPDPRLRAHLRPGRRRGDGGAAPERRAALIPAGAVTPRRADRCRGACGLGGRRGRRSGARFGRPKQFDLLAGSPGRGPLGGRLPRRWRPASSSSCRDDRLDDAHGADVVVAGGAPARPRCGWAWPPCPTRPPSSWSTTPPVRWPDPSSSPPWSRRWAPAPTARSAASPVSDTLKRVDAGRAWSSTVDRATGWWPCRPPRPSRPRRCAGPTPTATRPPTTPRWWRRSALPSWWCRGTRETSSSPRPPTSPSPSTCSGG